MKPGKVSDTVRKRTVLKQLNNRHTGIWPEPSLEEVCYGIHSEAGDVILAEAARYGNQKDLGFYALMAAVNDLAAAGASLAAAYVRIMLTGYCYESRLKAMTEEIERAAVLADVQVMDIKAEVVPVINSSIVYITAAGMLPGGMSAGAGRRADECLGQSPDRKRTRGGHAGQELVLTKWVGMEGTLRILEEKREELCDRFVPAFLNQTSSLRAYLSAMKEAAIASCYGVSAMRQVSEEGIMTALWRMAESSDTGLSVALKAIPVRQETIEICEYYHINPYELTSAGCILMAADDGQGLAAKLGEENIPAAVIGSLTAGNDRVILRGEEVSYLERPQPEALAECFALWNQGGIKR